MPGPRMIPQHSDAVRFMTLQLIAEPINPREERLESLIEHRLGNRVRDLRVVVRPTGLVLQGRASTYHAKQLAQHAAMEAADLPILSNEIEVTQLATASGGR